MSYRQTAFGPGEWYHCYSRGVDKRRTFESAPDYQRFMELLYVCNSATSIHLSNLWRRTNEEVLSVDRSDTLVDIGAYALMPNHFHLLLYEKNDGGITKFMHKLGTSYTMYFNLKYERVGNLFVKPFRSKNVARDNYFQHISRYIHLNPAELFESGWKHGKVKDVIALDRRLRAYPYSSLMDYLGQEDRPQKRILDVGAIATLTDSTPLMENISDAIQYYRTLD